MEWLWPLGLVSAWAVWKSMSDDENSYDVPTVWGGNVGLTAQIARAIPVLQAARSRAVQLHTSFEEVIARGATHAATMRAAGVRDVWFAFTGDEHSGDVAAGRMTPAALLELRVRAAKAARDAGARNIVHNCEAAWKHGAPGFDAAAAEAMTTRIARDVGVRQWLTSYPAPTMHRALPWASFKVYGHLPQIYFEGNAWDGAWRIYSRSWSEAVASGLIHPGAKVGAYVRTHGNGTEAIAKLACKLPFAAYWWLSDGADDAGRAAFVALGRIQAVGFLGPGRVEGFQRARGLAVTGSLDAATLAATERL